MPSEIRISLVVIMFGLWLAPRGVMAAQAPVPAATIDGRVITLDEVDQTIGANLAALTEQMFQLRRQRLETLIAEHLLEQESRRKGVTVAELLVQEVDAQVAPISDAAVEQFYEANKTRLPALDAGLRERIRGYLKDQATQARHDALVERLRRQADVKVQLPAPPIYRAVLNLDGAPSRGPDDAPVTLVKFEDFHCPFCKEAQRTLAELLARYGERLRLVHKDYPIDALHPLARKGHLAARCAQEQGKFWPYHDALYAAAPKAAPEDLKRYAENAGLELDRFEACVASGKYGAAVENDFAEGTRAGVTGTPAFFINGRLLGGAQPLEQFVRLIDEELAQRR